MADSTVKIGADISEVRRELAKLPNLSAEAAQKTLIQIEKSVQKAEKAATKAAKAIAKANKAAGVAAGKANKGASAAFKGTSQGLSSIALQLPDVASGLAMGTNAMTIFVQQGLQVVQVNMATTIKVLKLLVTRLAPLGVLIAALGAGYAIFAKRQREASDEAKIQQTILEELVPLSRKLEEVRLDLAVATGTMTKAERGLLKVREDAHAQLIASTATLRQALNERLEELRELQAKIEKMPAVGATAASAAEAAQIVAAQRARKELAALIETIAGLEAKLEGARAQTRATVQGHEDLAAAVDEETAALDLLRAGQDAAAKAADVQREAEKKLAAALGKVAEELGFMAEASRSLNDERRLQADLDALAPDDLIDPATITRVRELIASVDKIVPPEGLAKIDQLRQVLFQLGAESDAAGGKNEELADAIRRVKGEIEDLEDSTPDPGDVLTFWEAFSIGAAAAASAVSTVSGAVSGLVGGFDRFLSLAGGFSLADLGAIAAEGGDVSGAVEELIQGGRDTVKVFVESLPAVIDAFVAELPGLIDDFISAIGPVVSAVGSAIPVVIDQIVKALPGLVSTVADLITSGLFDQIIEKLPTVVSAILDELPTVITALLSAVGDVVAAIIFQIPAITLALIEAIPEILAAVVVALPDLAFAIVDAVLFELLPRMPEISIAITQALLADLPVALAEAFVDNVIGFLGRLDKGNQPQSTETFNDTPGPVRAGLSGLTARFAPGDTVIAAQDPAEALRQAQQASNGTTGGSQSVTLDLRDGHLAFDRMFRRNIRAGGSLGQLSNAAIGRVKVYG